MSQKVIAAVLLFVWVLFAALMIYSATLTSGVNFLAIVLIPNALIIVSGSIIVWKTDQRTIGWILVVLGVAFGAWAGVFDHLAALQGWVGAGIGIISLLIYLILIFPSGQLLSRAAHVTVWVAVIGGIAASIVGSRGSGESGTESLPEQLTVGFYGVLMLVAVAIQIVSFRDRPAIERTQIKWFLYGVGLSALLYIGAVALRVSADTFLTIDAVATSIWPLAILVAILKYRLFEIDRLISRTVSYGLVVALLGGVFVALTWLPGFLINGAGGPGENASASPLIIATSTLAVAALFNPLRKRMQHAVDRRFNRSGYQAQIVADEFAAKMKETHGAEEVATIWVSTVDRALQPATISIWMRLEQSHN